LKKTRTIRGHKVEKDISGYTIDGKPYELDEGAELVLEFERREIRGKAIRRG